MHEHDLQPRLDFALHAAIEAGKVTLELFRTQSLGIETKGDGTPVTRADRMAEHTFRQLVGARYPGDAVAGEEYGLCEGTSGYTWIVDPIDGTFSFIHGVPLYGTLVGLERDRHMVLGVIHMPALNESVYAARGHGAWHKLGDAEPRRATVSSVGSLEKSTVLTTSSDYFRKGECLSTLDALQRACGNNRGWSDCYASLLVATGRAEAVVEPEIHKWDVAAIQPIVEEAGGRYSDWSGVNSVESRDALITNGHVHDALLAMLPTSSPAAH